MKYFDAFSGIGGFAKGIENVLADAECVGFSEIDKYAKAIYQHQFENHKDYGDITAINESRLPNFDLFVGGFPCQAFSIAGKRQGFEDTRGTLFFDVARILSAKRPKWFVLENVKGLLNHDNGRTIATILGVLTELGYSVGWEVVNSCHFGVPQNRERIIIIGCLAEGSTTKVFPIRQDGELPEPPSKSGEGQSQAQLGTSLKASGTLKADDTYVLQKIDKKGKPKKNQDIAACLTGGGHSGGNHSDMDLIKIGTLRTHKDGEGFREIESGLSPTIPARAREDGSGQPVIRVPEATKKGFAEAKPGQAINLTAINSKTRRGRVSDLAHTLDTGAQQYTSVRAVLTPDRKEKRQNGRRIKENEEPSFTLTSQDKHGVAIDHRIRRLTPIECERLQGFPDDWTKLGIYPPFEDEGGLIKRTSDTQRYKTLGNAVTVNVIEAIIAKIANIEGWRLT